LLVLVDDDNVLERNYLTEAIKIADSHADLGVFGGRCLPHVSGAIPPEGYRRAFALRYPDKPVVSRDLSLTDAPFGAGMVVRSKVAQAYGSGCVDSPWRNRLGRRGRIGGAGEDLDLVVFMIKHGFAYGLFPALVLRHLIPASRLDPRYLRELVRVNNYSLIWIRLNHDLPVEPLPHLFPAIFLEHIRVLVSRLSCDTDATLRLSRRLGQRQALRDFHRLERTSA
jgi:GT2 family glycosyltransferase